MKAVALKLVLRSWWRNKTFSIISIVSLAIGIACTNLLAAFVIYEFNIEADNPNKEKIVYMAQDSPLKSGEKVSFIGRFYKFNLSLANSQNLIKATANVILLSQI